MAERLGSVQWPIGIAQQLTSQEHQIGLTGANNWSAWACTGD